MAANPPNPVVIADEISEYQAIFEAAVDGLLVSDAETGQVLKANPAVCRLLGLEQDELIGLNISDLTHADGRQQFSEQIRAFKPGMEIDYWNRDMRPNGTISYSRWRAGALQYRGRPCLLWNVRDTTERIQAEQTLRQRMRTQTREQSALLETSHALASALELPPVLLLEQLREVIPFDRGAFFTSDGSSLLVRAVFGVSELEHALPLKLDPAGPNTLQKLFDSRRPIRIPHISSSQPDAARLRALLGDEGAALLQGMQAWMWVPLVMSAGVLGTLGVASHKSAGFTTHHADLALMVADQAVVAMTNADLYRNAQSIAAAQERRRLAQSLHDAVNQSLFSAGLIAEVLPRIWSKNEALGRQSLESMRRLLRAAAAEMRALMAELRPSTLTDVDLGTLLRLLAEAFTGRTNVPVALVVRGESALPPDVQVAAYRICQEALNNIGKHAHATKVDIKLHEDDHSVELLVCDDGTGFDPAARVPGHYGLSMMCERAEAVGAHLSIQSAPGCGTRLSLCWSPGEPEPQP